MSSTSHMSHDILSVSGRHQMSVDTEERREWSTYLTIPGIRHPFLITFPPMKLPVCTKCKRQFKTRKYCRKNPRKHMSLPWSVTYLCLTFDDLCFDSDSQIPNNRIMKMNKPFTAKIVEFVKPLSTRNHWRPFMFKENRETLTLKNYNNDDEKVPPSPSDMSNNNCSSINDRSSLPMCMDCKNKRYTSIYCRGRTNPHKYLPWSTVFYDVFCEEEKKDDTIEEEGEEYNRKSNHHETDTLTDSSVATNTCSMSTKKEMVHHEFAFNSNAERRPNIFDDLIGPCTNTLFVQISAKECTVEWLEYDNEKAKTMQKDQERTTRNDRNMKQLKTSQPKKTSETSQEETNYEEEAHDMVIPSALPPLPPRSQAFYHHQYPCHEPGLHAHPHHRHSFPPYYGDYYNYSPVHPPPPPYSPHHMGGDSFFQNNHNNNNKREIHDIHNHYIQHYQGPTNYYSPIHESNYFATTNNYQHPHQQLNPSLISSNHSSTIESHGGTNDRLRDEHCHHIDTRFVSNRSEQERSVSTNNHRHYNSVNDVTYQPQQAQATSQSVEQSCYQSQERNNNKKQRVSGYSFKDDEEESNNESSFPPYTSNNECMENPFMSIFYKEE